MSAMLLDNCSGQVPGITGVDLLCELHGDVLRGNCCTAGAQWAHGAQPSGTPEVAVKPRMSLYDLVFRVEFPVKFRAHMHACIASAECTAMGTLTI